MTQTLWTCPKFANSHQHQHLAAYYTEKSVMTNSIHWDQLPADKRGEAGDPRLKSLSICLHPCYTDSLFLCPGSILPSYSKPHICFRHHSSPVALWPNGLRGSTHCPPLPSVQPWFLDVLCLAHKAAQWLGVWTRCGDFQHTSVLLPAKECEKSAYLSWVTGNSQNCASNQMLIHRRCK